MTAKTRTFKPTDKFLINQFSFHTFPGFGWIKKLIPGVPALSNRSCRLYFFGQLVSTIGSWMQIVALSWLVFQLTNSAFWVGVAAACATLPALFFALIGGSIVDNFPKKTVLIIMNFLAMVLALVLGLLTLTHHINLFSIILISLIQGIIGSISTPAHFSFIGEVANKGLLSSAMAVNASVTSLSRILGPIVAGLYIHFAGPGGAFILNAISYLAVLVALFVIKSKGKKRKRHLHPFQSIKAGVVYVYGHPMIRSVVIYVGIASIFAWSYATIIPVVAKNIFHTNATGMSYLYSAIGLGGLASTIISAIFSHRLSKLSLFLFGNTLFAVSLFLFTFTDTLMLGILYVFLSGLGLVLINIVLGTMIQHLADPQYRGRVSSIYYLVYGGVLFLGNLEIGYLTDLVGPQIALRFNTSVMLLVGLYILLNRHQLRQAQTEYNHSLQH